MLSGKPTPPNPSNNNISSNLENGNGAAGKRKRRPAGTPDPEAEVVSLSPRTLMEADRYVCEICNQGFQREQNLQMHRRRHKVPWKLVKRDPGEVRRSKRVYVCPEASCLHHDPRHALGDLVGIKKHFRRKHSGHRQWVCCRCSKAYAVHSDYKAHLKTCGTRGHSCDCGRVFSRVESFIEHQDACNASRARGGCADAQPPRPLSLSWTTSSTSPSTTDTNVASAPAISTPAAAFPPSTIPLFNHHHHNHTDRLELQLLPSSNYTPQAHTTTCFLSPDSDDVVVEAQATELQLSIGINPMADYSDEQLSLIATREEALVISEARQQAMKQVELAVKEFTNAKRIRQQAQAELENACLLRDHATRQINSMLLQITCHSCRKQFQPNNNNTGGTKPDEINSLATAPSYVSSSISSTHREEGRRQ